jgi:hypothetical protein
LSVLEPVKDIARGRDLETEALEIYRSLGDRSGEAWLIWALGCNSQFAGDDETALTDLSTSVERFRALDDSFGVSWGLRQAGLSAVRLDRRELAERNWHEALGIFAAVDDISGIDAVIDDLGRLAAAEGRTRRAIRLAAAGARIRGVSESSIAEMANWAVREVAPRGARLADDDIDAARREGAAMSTAEAVAYALEPVSGHGDPRLRVQALGSMLVERRGLRMRTWGGEKAGSRQAQALFAFLFDRGSAGIAKDEVTELIWPDLEIRRADLAFHRTLGGLRSVLNDGAEGADAITYEGGRYRLAPDVVAWDDVSHFETQLSAAVGLGGSDAILALEEARRLYRGDLFDDCPIYGDSAFVEARRAYLRECFEDLLIDLGDRYLKTGDPASAAACYRQALVVDADNPRAKDGLKSSTAAARARPA